jgi:hypothetical protein
MIMKQGSNSDRHLALETWRECSSGNHQKRLNYSSSPVPQVFPVHSTLRNSSLKAWVHGPFVQDADSLTYSSLVQFWRRSIRNRSWGRLSIAERGLYRCALWIAKVRTKITNTRLMVQILRIALKLGRGLQSRIVSAGSARADVMCEEYARPGGVFSWAPRMREWLHDRKYIVYLGVLEVNA